MNTAKRLAISFLIVGGTIGILYTASFVFATPPTSPYLPGETLNPTCAPGDTNCTVSANTAGNFIATDSTATSTFSGALAVTGQISAGFFTATSSTATSSFANGINLANGCFAIGGTCINGGGGGFGTVNTGTAGQFAYYASNGTAVSGTSVLTISGNNIGIGTTSPYASLSVAGANGVVANLFTATSTTATSTFTNVSATQSALGTIISGTWQGSTIAATFGGTGISSPTAAGVLLGSYAGGSYQQLATSSLGLLTTNVAEGTNLYYTDTRVNNYIAASTTILKTYTSNTFTALQQFQANASSTLTSVYNGIYVGTTATTTIFGTATSTFGAGIQTTALNVTSSTASSTFANGINLSAGCFAVNSTCVGSGGSGTVGSGIQGQFPFYNAAGTTLTATSSLFITQSGNIGIGTTSPWTTLSIAGNTDAQAYYSNGYLLGLATTTGQNYFLAGASATTTAALSGVDNIFIGFQSGINDTTGHNNTALGYQALNANTTGTSNTAIGWQALNVNTTGISNVANGQAALLGNTTGSSNTALGYQALDGNTSGSSNVVIGSNAAQNFGVYNENVILGVFTNFGASSANASTTEVGYKAGFNNGGNASTLLGYQAGYDLTTGNYNIAIGQNIDLPSATTDGQLNIGNLIYGTNVYTGSIPSSSPTNGKVGIGTTTPFGLFSINPNRISGPSFVIGSSTATNFIVTNAGNVGIGTTNPTSPLTVSSANVQIHLVDSANTAWNSDIFEDTTGLHFKDRGNGLVDVTDGARNIRLYADDTAAGVLVGPGGGCSGTFCYFKLYTDTGNGIYINSDANASVSVGSTSPSARLSVWGATTGTARTFEVDNSASTTNFVVLDNGKVGIGTTSPASTLTVTGSGCVSGGAGATVACPSTAGTLNFRAGGTANVDLAENYQTADPSVEAGDVVMLDPSSPLSVKKAGAHTQQFLGVVSTDPGLLLGGGNVDFQGSSTRPVALAGRVPVKVSNENGQIHAGDYLTTSSVPGVAMKATESGNVIGTALEDATSSPSKILVFIKTGFANININASSTVVEDDSSLWNDLTLLLLGTKDWMFSKITAVTGIFKNIFAQNITTQNLTIKNANAAQTGITLFDRVTGQPNCIYIENGVMKNISGACTSTTTQALTQPTQQTQQTGTQTTTSAITASTSTDQVIITPVITATSTISTSTAPLSPVSISTPETTSSTTPPEPIIPISSTTTTNPDISATSTN